MSSRILDLRDAFSFGDRDWLGSHAARSPLGAFEDDVTR